MQVRRVSVALATGVAVVLGLASVAWACTPTARVLSVSPGTASPGSQVDIAVESVSTQGPVEIRWNSLTGERLATATWNGEAYAASVAVPEVAPGVYTLVATADGAGVARTSFEVTPATAAVPTPAAAVTPADRWAPRAVLDAAPSGANPGVVAGSALLAVGLVSAFAGFAVAAGRRRRVLAEVPERLV